MVDVLRNSIYGIMYAFHDKMLMSTKAGLIEKDWVTKSKLFLEPMSSLYRNCVISCISKLTSELNRIGLKGGKIKLNKK